MRRENDKARAQLRVKIKSLSAESRIIRAEERRAKSDHNRDLLTALSEHRRVDVRRAARETNLAYAFIRCVPYAAVERPGSRPVDWNSVRKMICRFLGVHGEREIGMFNGEIEKWRRAVVTADDQPGLFSGVSA